MARPFVTCFMMATADGRIDCKMLEKIESTGYYETLDALGWDTMIEGRVTGVLELAEGTWAPRNPEKIGKPCFWKARESCKWQAVADSRGTLAWSEKERENSRVCLLSEAASAEYLDYLRKLGISYVVAGKDRVDLGKALEILAREFGSRRVVVSGGGRLNGAFLRAGLIDEVVVVYGPAVDGREGGTAVFDGFPAGTTEPVRLKLKDIARLSDDSVRITWSVPKEARE